MHVQDASDGRRRAAYSVAAIIDKPCNKLINVTFVVPGGVHADLSYSAQAGLQEAWLGPIILYWARVWIMQKQDVAWY
jgi:hypothetical protein